jgi:hypothetical protein
MTSAEPSAASRYWLAAISLTAIGGYSECMTVRELLVGLQYLPRDLEVLAFEAGCDDYCEREVDELDLQGGRVYLHLGARRDVRPSRDRYELRDDPPSPPPGL